MLAFDVDCFIYHSNRNFVMTETLILVDEQDNQTGTAEKMEAHENPRLHRALSVVLFNAKGEMLIQQRASTKYHAPDLWANACCSHPRPEEPTDAAAHRRLKEEMGFDCGFKEAFHFTYKAEVGNNLTEHEYDHVFVGTYDGEVNPNPEEVGAYKFMNVDDMKMDIAEHPEKYAPWFRILLVEFEKKFPGLKPE